MHGPFVFSFRLICLGVWRSWLGVPRYDRGSKVHTAAQAMLWILVWAVCSRWAVLGLVCGLAILRFLGDDIRTIVLGCRDPTVRRYGSTKVDV